LDFAGVWTRWGQPLHLSQSSALRRAGAVDDAKGHHHHSPIADSLQELRANLQHLARQAKLALCSLVVARVDYVDWRATQPLHTLIGILELPEACLCVSVPEPETDCLPEPEL
jgi:hypothetical protein